MKIGLKQIGKDAPRWVQRLAALLALLSVSRSSLIDTMPFLSETAVASVGGWYDYTLGVSYVGIAVFLLFTGRDDVTGRQIYKNDTEGN